MRVANTVHEQMRAASFHEIFVLDTVVVNMLKKTGEDTKAE
jgi:hypothetical protein